MSRASPDTELTRPNTPLPDVDSGPIPVVLDDRCIVGGGCLEFSIAPMDVDTRRLDEAVGGFVGLPASADKNNHTY